MTTIHPADGSGYIAYTKGAPEAVIDGCVGGLTADGHEAIDRARAGSPRPSGWRAMACACLPLPAAMARRCPDDQPSRANRTGPHASRPGRAARPAARRKPSRRSRACRAAGITPVMITGDHPATARAIARASAFSTRGGRSSPGAELGAMSDEDLADRVADIRVYARVDPAEDPHRRGPAGARRVRRDDRRRRQRRAGAQARRHRRRHGQDRHRRRPRGRRAWCCSTTTSPPSSPPCARAGASTTTSASSSSYIMTCNSGGDLDDLPGAIPRPADAAAADPDPVDQPGHRRPAGAGAGRRAGGAGHHAPPAATAPGKRLRRRNVAAHGLGRPADGGVSLSTQAYAIGIGSPHWQTMVFTVLTLRRWSTCSPSARSGVAVSAGALLQPSAARRRRPDLRPAAGHHLRAGVQSDLQHRSR